MNLHELIEKGDLCGLRQAAADGADMNASFPESDECLLSAAATKGDAELVQLLLTLGANPHHRETVTPPLVAAAAGGSVECVRLILEAGAEIDVRDEDGATPLMVAATYGHTKVVQELLSRNAETKLKDRFGNSALSSAAIKGHSETCNVLLPA